MNILTSFAARGAAEKKFKNEYGIGIAIILILRFLTACISIFAGYFYFANLLSGINTENKTIPIILAVLVLLIVEVLSAWLVAKLSKSLINGKILASAILLTFSVLTVGISFVSSTNGLAMRQAQKSDVSKEIYSEFEIKKTAISANYENIISEQKNNIDLVRANPQGWKGGQRYYLTAEQLQQISDYNMNIKLLRESETKELTELSEIKNKQISENREIMTETASKYYTFISIVLLISVLCNISIPIMYKIIYREEKPRESVANQFESLRRAALNNMQDKLLQDLAELNNSFQIGISERTDAVKSKKPAAIAGFLKDIPNRIEPPKEQPKQLDIQAVNNSTGTKIHGGAWGSGECVNCGKSFVRMSHNQKYCTELCRLEYYEKRTGKDASKFKKML